MAVYASLSGRSGMWSALRSVHSCMIRRKTTITYRFQGFSTIARLVLYLLSMKAREERLPVQNN